MKVIKVEIRVDRDDSGAHYTWPDIWSHYYERMNVVAYQPGGEIGHGLIEYCLAIGKDTVVNDLLAESDPAITWLSAVEANILGRAWRPQQTVVDGDRNLVSLVEKHLAAIRFQKEQGLLPDLLASLDPDDETQLGIGKTPAFDVANYGSIVDP